MCHSPRTSHATAFSKIDKQILLADVFIARLEVTIYIWLLQLFEASYVYLVLPLKPMIADFNVSIISVIFICLSEWLCKF